jgi:aspartate/methionine/tyrosine aminotransferase
MERQLALIRANLEALDTCFARWRHVIEWQRPAAGTIAFPRLVTGEAVEGWCEELVRQAGVLLLPATVYDHAPSTAAGRFRLGFGRSDLPECLRHLEAWLAARYGPPAGAPAAGTAGDAGQQ